MRVTVLGAGVMGAPMACNLVAAGHDVTVWNRTRERAAPLARDGANVAADPGEAVEAAEVVLTILTDGEAVREVMGDGLSAMRQDAVWWQASTVGLEATDELARLAGERGVAYVDAPVLGTKQPAQDGKLIVLASGPSDALERCAPLFDAVGVRTLELGEAGAGTRLKLVVNHWIFVLVEGLAETIAYAEGLGVDPQLFLDAIEGGPLDCGYVRVKGKAMLEREFPPSMTLANALKDVTLILDAAERHGVDLGLAPEIRSRFDRAAGTGHAEEDMAAALYASVDGSEAIPPRRSAPGR